MKLPPSRLTEVRAEDARTFTVEASKKILDFWDRVRGDKFAPALGKDFHLDDLDLALVPCMSVVDVVADGKDYLYRFWGTRNVGVKAMEMTGKLLSECPLPGIIEHGQWQFPEVIRRRAPTAFIYVGHYHSAIMREQTTYRFPLSRDGDTVDGILSYQDLDNQSETWISMFDDLWGGNRPELRIGRSKLEDRRRPDC